MYIFFWVRMYVHYMRVVATCECFKDHVVFGCEQNKHQSEDHKLDDAMGDDTLRRNFENGAATIWRDDAASSPSPPKVHAKLCTTLDVGSGAPIIHATSIGSSVWRGSNANGTAVSELQPSAVAHDAKIAARKGAVLPTHEMIVRSA
jgi:hypothetical protein